MPVPVPDGYFQTGVFHDVAPGECFNHYSCLTCGTRLKTWASFKAHRAAATCRPLEEHGASLQPGWVSGVMPAIDRVALDALLAQLPDPEPTDTAQWLEETLSLGVARPLLPMI